MKYSLINYLQLNSLIDYFFPSPNGWDNWSTYTHKLKYLHLIHLLWRRSIVILLMSSFIHSFQFTHH